MKGIRILGYALMLSAAPALSANIYKPESEANHLFAAVEDVLPKDAVIVYVMKDDRGRFLKQIDGSAFLKAGLSTTTIDYLLDRVSPKLTAKSGVRAYTVSGNNIPGNDERQKFTAIVVTSDRWAKDKGTMFHETLHAKNAYVNGTPAYQNALLPAWKKTKNLTPRQFMGLFDEAVVAGQQVAYTYNEKRSAGIEMIEKYASYGHNGRVSIGYRTARNMLKKCGRKDACPTETVAMIKTIVGDTELLNDLLLDIDEIMVASKKMGVIVADE
ncbi:hypothetical protein NP572_19535 [Pseudomonas putida]|uniref:hypothetical protein n=1 Tax=Pseudomonas putida TaxID=303 RepID=UPI0023641B29|nr:hypothetical protein [Pseudomonas putida]MDD2038744.1 hypothetical protein [Pseudomonas putida]MDD2044311.1 hypothetical protein [Pseudomonas putida]